MLGWFFKACMLNVLIVGKYVNFWDGVNFRNIYAEAQADLLRLYVASITNGNLELVFGFLQNTLFLT